MRVRRSPDYLRQDPSDSGPVIRGTTLQPWAHFRKSLPRSTANSETRSPSMRPGVNPFVVVDDVPARFAYPAPSTRKRF
jgi:hypothetical protein